MFVSRFIITNPSSEATLSFLLTRNTKLEERGSGSGPETPAGRGSAGRGVGADGVERLAADGGQGPGQAQREEAADGGPDERAAPSRLSRTHTHTHTHTHTQVRLRVFYSCNGA